MANSFLEQFLELGLLPGVDDTNFGKLQTAAESLAGTLQTDASALRRYSYALLDANLSDDDPVLDVVEEVVKGEWKTLRSLHQGRPVQLLRGVLGQAITGAVPAASFSAETILLLTASSVLPYTQLGRERSLIEGLFREYGRKAEEKALAAWDAKPPAVTMPQKPSIKLNVTGEDLATLASSTQTAFNQVVSHLDVTTTNVLSSLKKHSTHSRSNKTQIDLLWWKEALYSSSLETGYRRLTNPVVTVAALAFDFFNLLPSAYPHSAEYFFREVIYELLGHDTAHRWSLSDFCAQVSAAEKSSEWFSGISSVTNGRIPLLAFLDGLCRGDAEPTDAPCRVGISDEIILSADDLAVWLLRELQASCLAGEEDHQK